MADTILFEDIFDVKDIDPDGPKFDRGMPFCVVLRFFKYRVASEKIENVKIKFRDSSARASPSRWT
jgi:hypothetical protein